MINPLFFYSISSAAQCGTKKTEVKQGKEEYTFNPGTCQSKFNLQEDGVLHLNILGCNSLMSCLEKYFASEIIEWYVVIFPSINPDS